MVFVSFPLNFFHELDINQFIINQEHKPEVIGVTVLLIINFIIWREKKYVLYIYPCMSIFIVSMFIKQFCQLYISVFSSA